MPGPNWMGGVGLVQVRVAPMLPLLVAKMLLGGSTGATSYPQCQNHRLSAATDCGRMPIPLMTPARHRRERVGSRAEGFGSKFRQLRLMSVNSQLLVTAIFLFGLSVGGSIQPVSHMLTRIAAPRQADGHRRAANGAIALTKSSSASAGTCSRRAKRVKWILPPRHGQRPNVQKAHPTV
jgi:hypothetical protein